MVYGDYWFEDWYEHDTWRHWVQNRKIWSRSKTPFKNNKGTSKNLVKSKKTNFKQNYMTDLDTIIAF